MDDLSGQVLKGYEIGERIGAGNFGAVYWACQTSVDREVAIKVILPNYANDPDFIRRFEAEAQLVARLEHPHIVPLFDYWREPDCAYLVMRLLPNNLRAVLESRGSLPLHDTVQLVDQITSALALSHRQGVVHRDIKPDNILLDSNGNAYLTDFGLAKVIAGSRQDDEDSVTGSPAYMSPEQLTSEPLTPQSDMYALGVVIYEMLTGIHPFDDLTISELIARHLMTPLPSVTVHRPDLPEAVDYVIQKATAKNARERYPDMLVLARDFRQALLGEHIVTAPLATDSLIENPYKGLRAFEEADSADFFGRESLVDQLIASLSETDGFTRFLAVVGPSGSGKSSLVKAGLIPALRDGVVPGSERWFVVNMLPGPDLLTELETALLSVARRPIDNLREQLAAHHRGLVSATERVLEDTDGDVLLVIDQFEETFTAVHDEAQRAQFLALLHTAVTAPESRVRVIITLRADFYDRPLLYEDFGALVRARTCVVLPLTTAELEQAIVEPARRAGAQVEPNLIAAIVADVRKEPGALPLLQYALTEVFERRQGRVMTMEGYEAINRATGALARRAERVYEGLFPVQQDVAQQVFLRLVTLGEGSEDVRRRTRHAELVSIVPDQDVLQDVLDIFGRHRLLSFDHVPATREPTVEVAHEALIREWGRLRDWLNASREDMRQQRRLAGHVAAWRNADQDPSYLLRGVQLQQFEFWSAQTNLALTEHERDYMAASIDIREKQQAQEQARQERLAALEARARRFQRRLSAMMFVAMIVALVLSLLAFDQREEARSARDAAQYNAALAQTEAESAATAAAVAQQRADEIQSLALAEDASRAFENHEIDTALALALEANRIPDPPVQVQSVLSELAPTAAIRLLEGHTGSVGTVAMIPDGTHAISGGDDGLLLVWDLTSGEMVQILTGHTDQVRSIAVTPDGTRAISGADDAAVIVWDLESGEALYTLTGHADDVFAVAVSPDERRVISGSRDQTLILWDLDSGEAIRQYGAGETGHESRVTCVAFSPDGQTVLSGSADKTLILWDVASGGILGRLEGHEDVITSAAFSPNGRQILSASADKTLVLWDVQSLTIVNRLIGHTERVTAVAFGPGGRWAVSGAGNPFAGASSDNSLILWDLFLGQPVRVYRGHSRSITGVAVSPDGRTIISAAADSTLRVWAVEFDIEFDHWAVADARFDAVAFSPDRTLAILDTGLLAIWPHDSTAEARQFALSGHDGPVNAVAVSPDGTQALTASADHTLILWDLETGDMLRRFAGHSNEVNAVIFTPDGTRALSASRDRSLILWDVASGDPLRVFEKLHTNVINAVAISSDGAYALSASEDQTLILWNLATGEMLRSLHGHDGGVTAVTFSPDGRRALSGAQDKKIVLWDVGTGTIIQRFGDEASGHTDWVTAVAFSVDARLAISGSRDRTVRIWDLASGQEVRRYDAFSADVLALSPAAGGQTVYAAGETGIIRQLPVSNDGFIDWLTTHRYVRPLTCQERTLYHLEECD
ncbi:MAG: protein kinase [Anaerolineae bacterium]|nr:protein kinase [Anaerolineae bacterium]